MRYVLIILISLISISTHAEQVNNSPYLAVQKDDIILGQDSAPVTIIEYSALSCPSCAYFHNDILPEIEKKYIDTGFVKLIFRHYPMHPIDIKASMISLCADKSSYYTFLKVFFKTQKNWAFESSRPEEVLGNIARLGGLTGAQIDSCLADKNIENQVLESRKIAQTEFAINATPSIIINGEIFRGVPSKTRLFKIIDQIIEKAQK